MNEANAQLKTYTRESQITKQKEIKVKKKNTSANFGTPFSMSIYGVEKSNKITV